MDASKGILTAVGGKSSHAAVVARGMGVPCVVGCGALSINERGKTATVKAAEDHVSRKAMGFIDGPTGAVCLARPPRRIRIPIPPPSPSS
jgi:pyruvate,orthophosphate dikinase